MVNVILLRKKIDESGYKLRYIASRLGLTYAGFLAKMDGKSDFKVGEARTLVGLLQINETERGDIFFTDCGSLKLRRAEPVEPEPEGATE